MKCFLGVSDFLEEISSFSHSTVFLYFSALITETRLSYLSLLFFGTLHSNGYIFPFLLCLLFLFSQLFVRPPQTTILLFCISFSWGGSWSLPPVQCHEPPSIVLQVLCLSDLILWIHLSLPLYNCKGFDLGQTWSSAFPYFLQFQSEFGNKEFMIWTTISSWSCFADCIEHLHLWLQRI